LALHLRTNFLFLLFLNTGHIFKMLDILVD